MTLREARVRFAQLLPRLIDKAFDLGFELMLEDGQCRDGHMPQSLHYMGLAQDISLFKDGIYLTDTEDYRELGMYWESLDPHCRWGGTFPNPDGDHFSFPVAELTGNRA